MDAEVNPPGVVNEVGRLRTVMLHRPGPELKRLTPRNNDKLLFDGIPWVSRAQEEHDRFADVLRDQLPRVAARLLEQDGNTSFNWLDLTLAQSYHVGGVQQRARDFTPGVQPILGSLTQPLQPATVAIDDSTSMLWARVMRGISSSAKLVTPFEAR